jgi:hypothetical protein
MVRLDQRRLAMKSLQCEPQDKGRKARNEMAEDARDDLQEMKVNRWMKNAKTREE